MDSDRRDLNSPPPLEEGYWQALLYGGEFPTVTYPNGNGYHNGNGSNGNHHANPLTNQHQQINTQNGSQLPVVDEREIAADWQEIEIIMENDETVDLTVMGYNRGGLLVEWRNIRGFVPASQLIDFPSDASPAVRRDTLINQIGKVLTLRVIELDRNQNRLVLSERASEALPGQREGILVSLRKGDIVQGDVTNITEFGVFVNLGGIEGLIHISELSWGRVRHPADIFDRGNYVTVYVLDTNPNMGRVALSVKRLTSDPWQNIDDRYSIGQIVQGKITNVVDFGAFACIEDGIEGLIHVSELAEGHFLHPRNVVQEGQNVSLVILNMDKTKRRLGLSLRKAQQ